ncbi:hypothetical protein GOBAR_AA19748 [Gossypium barbadense]|uniref:Plant intracellular Ras-group-related LRR protein 6-like n=1 Tax=Gossypium barbadense TaxID=3634 RepID=A0A2P5XC78_GOSBA|nr:hypothetical protein GOBAR_AA19748 [Gossypium barbadense]
MMSEQQQQVTFMEMSKNKGDHRSRRRCMEEGRVRVDMSGMSLDSFPILSLNLATISNLDLSNNNLESIPESMTARLLNVVALDVHSNQLKFLPNSIGCLSKLKILNVSSNLLHTLPKTIENCKSLEELNANFNQLSVLPDTIGFELINLKKLSVNANKLCFLPQSISHLTSLRVLDARLNCLSYNKITSLPDSIGCLKKLQKLCVEGNPLVSPPMEVFEQSLQAVNEYLSEKMKAGQSPPKKQSWVGKLVKCGTFNGKIGGRRGEREGFIMISEYRSIEGLASPRYMGLLSPRRLFSPRYMGLLSPRRLFSPRTYLTE